MKQVNQYPYLGWQFKWEHLIWMVWPVYLKKYNKYSFENDLKWLEAIVIGNTLNKSYEGVENGCIWQQ